MQKDDQISVLGVFCECFVGFVGVLAGYGLSFYYKGRRLLHDARPHGEQLSGQAQRLIRKGMGMFLTALILLALFSIIGVISHKFVVVASVLIGSLVGTFLATVLFTRGLIEQ